MLSALRYVNRVLGASQTGLQFLGGCGELLRGLSLLFFAPLARVILGTEVRRLAPATLLCDPVPPSPSS